MTKKSFVNLVDICYLRFTRETVVESAGNEIRSIKLSSSGIQLPSQRIFLFYPTLWLRPGVSELTHNTTLCAMEIPQGKTREEIKAREKIIKDFYARWIANNPSKSVWNKSLNALIKVKGLSINETYEHAARSYESTMEVLHLTEILSKAVVVSIGTRKADDKNQKAFSRIIVMRHKSARLVVGYQPSLGDYVQYSITCSKNNYPNNERASVVRKK